MLLGFQEDLVFKTWYLAKLRSLFIPKIPLIFQKPEKTQKNLSYILAHLFSFEWGE